MYVICLILFHFFYILYFAWICWKIDCFLFIDDEDMSVILNFLLADTRNVICTLHLWCPLDEDHKCFLGLLFMVQLGEKNLL